MNLETIRLFGAAALAGVLASAAPAADAVRQADDRPGAKRMSVMMLVGCLAQEGERWYLTRATEPVAAELPGSKAYAEPAADAALGSGRYWLMGTVSEFDVIKHKGHKVRVKGLVLTGDPGPRVNLTSLRHLAPACA
jgi:hypothetical protein